MTEIINSFEEVKKELESDEFYCDIGFASTVPALENRLGENIATHNLIRLIRTDPEIVEDVANYALEIARGVNGDTRSENDAALCACLMALISAADSSKTDELLFFLNSTNELGLWWAQQLAQRLTETKSSTWIDYAPTASLLSLGVNTSFNLADLVVA
jgi:hypothetical protein